MTEHEPPAGPEQAVNALKHRRDRLDVLDREHARRRREWSGGRNGAVASSGASAT